MSVPSSRSLILLVLTLVVSVVAAVSTYSVAPTKAFVDDTDTEKRKAARALGWKRPAGHDHAEPDEWHVLTGAYYDTRGRWTSKIVLNNKGRDPEMPKVTVFNANGRPYAVPNVVVPGTGFLELDLARVARMAGGSFSVGSVRIEYHGKKLQMGAQILVQDLERGLQLDEQMSYVGASPVNRVEGLWWRPSERAQMSVVLKNRSDESIVVRGRVKGPDRGGRPEGGLSTFRLGPQEIRIADFAGDGGGRLRSGDTAGGISLEFDGPAGALLARVLVADAQSGYSANVSLSYTTSAKTSTYHGGGVRRAIGDVQLTPVLLGRNISDTVTVVTGRLIFNRPDGSVDRIALPPLTLQPGETGLFDSGSVWSAVRTQAGDEGIGVEFEHTGNPGSVLMSTTLVSDDRNFVFRVPLTDPQTPPSSTGGYPWFADTDRATTVFLKNTTTTKLIYLLQVKFPGGTYAPGIKEIEPGQTIALDLRDLRDQQVPDAFGNTIPRSATTGQVTWTVKTTAQHAMIGRAEHTDTKHGVSASYACISCCPPTTEAVWVDSSYTEVGIGITTDLFVMAEDKDCYNNISAAYSMPWPYLNSWSIANTGIATSYADSTVDGVSDGETTFYAEFPGVSYHVEGTESGWYCHLDEGPINVQAPVKAQCAVPNNFKQTSAGDSGGGVLSFSYSWGSSVGGLSNLAQCNVGEVVNNYTSNPFPSPPFPSGINPPDPTIINVQGNYGGMGDNHSTPGTFVKPYSASTVTSTQIYRYQCPCQNNNAWTTLMGPHSIVRSVATNGSGGWKFTITKTGASATIDPLPTPPEAFLAWLSPGGRIPGRLERKAVQK